MPFHSPHYRCGHCKNLAPHWASAATELKGKVKLGALDATVHTVMASRYGIQGFPTIKFFPAGRKDWDSAQDYDGGRTGSDIVQWATNKWSENLPPPEVYQVTYGKVWHNCIVVWRQLTNFHYAVNFDVPVTIWRVIFMGC